jgi:hypothetical protein
MLREAGRMSSDALNDDYLAALSTAIDRVLAVYPDLHTAGSFKRVKCF